MRRGSLTRGFVATALLFGAVFAGGTSPGTGAAAQTLAVAPAEAAMICSGALALARSQIQAGEILQTAGDLVHARTAFERALEALRRLNAATPGEADVQATLIDALDQLRRLSRFQGDVAAADALDAERQSAQARLTASPPIAGDTRCDPAAAVRAQGDRPYEGGGIGERGANFGGASPPSPVNPPPPPPPPPPPEPSASPPPVTHHHALAPQGDRARPSPAGPAASVGTPPPPPAPNAAVVTDLLSQTKRLPVVYQPPPALALHKPVPFQLVIESAGAGSSKRAFIGPVITDAAQISNTVSAKLTGPPDVTITLRDQSQETQTVTDVANPTWVWDVTSQTADPVTLNLSIYDHFVIDGASHSVAYPVYTVRIPVQVSALDRLTLWIAGVDPIWKWLIGVITVIGGGIGWALNWYLKLRRRQTHARKTAKAKVSS